METIFSASCRVVPAGTHTHTSIRDQLGLVENQQCSLEVASKIGSDTCTKADGWRATTDFSNDCCTLWPPSSCFVSQRPSVSLLGLLVDYSTVGSPLWGEHLPKSVQKGPNPSYKQQLRLHRCFRDAQPTFWMATVEERAVFQTIWDARFRGRRWRGRFNFHCIIQAQDARGMVWRAVNTQQLRPILSKDSPLVSSGFVWMWRTKGRSSAYMPAVCQHLRQRVCGSLDVSLASLRGCFALHNRILVAT